MTKDTIREPARRTPVTGSFDVVVVGGGIAGVAAAIAAARNGASVCLVEKTCSLGGLATLGVVTVWLPLCDGRGRQVIAGLPEELLKLSVADLGRDAPRARLRGIPPCWRPGGDVRERTRRRYSAEFNPTAYLLALEKCAVDSGASLRYDTWVCGVRREAGAIRHLITESKDGRAALACRTVVDATGDADVCFLAGEQTESLDTNVLSGWYYHIEDGELVLNQLSNRFSERGDRQGAEGPFFRGDRAADVTAQVLGSRELIRRCLAARRAERPDVDIQPILLPTIPCFRMTRRLVGAMSLGEQHVHQWFDDCIGLTGDWRRPGPVYAIPYRAIAGVANRNLLAAGRCISADTTAWDVTRALPACAVTGVAAGTAAAMACRQTGGDVLSLDAAGLRDRLVAQGALIDPGLVAPAPPPDAG